MRYYQTYVKKLTFLEWLIYISNSEKRRAFKDEDRRIKDLVKKNYEVFEKAAIEKIKCRNMLWQIEAYFLKGKDYPKDMIDMIKNKGVSAEALYHAIHEERCLKDYDTAFKTLTLEMLRKHFISILK